MDLKDLTVLETETIKVAMEKMDASAKQIIYVVNDENQLVGVLTDGDTRRWILKENADIQSPVHLAMNKKPVFVKSSEKNNAKKIMKKNKVNSVPVVDDGSQITTIVFDTNELVTNKVTGIPVVIMAGGKGTRLYPYTKILPKPLIPIGDTPIMERIMNKFVGYGMNDFLISINYKKNMIKSYFADSDHTYNVSFVEEDTPLGTGGSLHLMKDDLKEQFFVSNCDILIDADYSDIVDFHNKNDLDITMVASLKNDQIPYGVLQLDEEGLLESSEEKPEFSYLVNTGMYLLEHSILDFIPENEAIDLPTAITAAKEAGKRVGVYPVSENSWLDMGQMKEMEHMIEKLGVD